MDGKLSDRLTALASLVSEGNRLADIGCDHAYVPILLCRTGKIPSAVAMDLGEGPLLRARGHIAAYGLEDRIETRQSDGLEKLGADEADTILIAGMGGLLMRRILTEHGIPEGVTELVLQPQSEIAAVRRCVREMGFSVADEDMVLEDGKFYPMMKARAASCMIPGGGRQETDPGEGISTEMEDAFGPVLLRKRHPVLFLWLEREADTTERILARLKEEAASAPDRERIGSRQRELEHKRELLEGALRLYAGAPDCSGS